MGKLRYCQSNSPDLGGTVPVLVSRRTRNAGENGNAKYEDVDAPSVATVLLYQLKYADAVSSGVTVLALIIRTANVNYFHHSSA